MGIDNDIDDSREPTWSGRPTLLWQLQNAENDVLECLAGETVDGRVLVEITQLGEEQRSRLFDDAAAAVQWALDEERSRLAAGGWAKMV